MDWDAETGLELDLLGEEEATTALLLEEVVVEAAVPVVEAAVLEAIVPVVEAVVLEATVLVLVAAVVEAAVPVVVATVLLSVSSIESSTSESDSKLVHPPAKLLCLGCLKPFDLNRRERAVTLPTSRVLTELYVFGPNSGNVASVLA